MKPIDKNTKLGQLSIDEAKEHQKFLLLTLVKPDEGTVIQMTGSYQCGFVDGFRAATQMAAETALMSEGTTCGIEKIGEEEV